MSTINKIQFDSQIYDLSVNPENIPSLYKEVTELPEVGEPNITYLLIDGESVKKYTYSNNTWVSLDTDIDLSNYYTKEETDNKITSNMITYGDDFAIAYTRCGLNPIKGQTTITLDSDVKNKISEIFTKIREHYGDGVTLTTVKIYFVSWLGNPIASISFAKILVGYGITLYSPRLEGFTDESARYIIYTSSAITATWNSSTNSYGQVTARDFTLSKDYVSNGYASAWTPKTDYSPIPKKYVDDAIREVELVKFPNVTIIGSPTIQQGQISGFTMNDYLEFPFLVDFRGNPFEINFAFTTGTNVDTQQNILDSDFGLAFAIRNKHVVLAISVNGTSWLTEQTGTLTLQPQTSYRYRITWNRLVYKVQYSTDGGQTYTDDISFAQNYAPYPKQMYIGVGKLADNYFEGIINLNYANVKVSDQLIWQGLDDVGLSTRLATDMSNIDSAGIEYINSLIDAKVTSALESEY